MQHINLKQLELKVNDIYQKNEKTNFEPFIEENVLIKAYLDAEVSKVETHISVE